VTAGIVKERPVSLVDVVGSAIINAMDVVPPHDCSESVDCDGSCIKCAERARYVIVQLDTVGVDVRRERYW
jgi:hypothetical protein